MASDGKNDEEAAKKAFSWKELLMAPVKPPEDPEKKKDKKDKEEKQQKQDSGKKKGEQNNKDGKKDDQQDNSTLKEKTGFSGGDLLKAPIEPPNIDNPRAPTPKQATLFMRGLIVMVVGLVLYPIAGFAITTAIVVIGLIIVIISVLVRIGDSKNT